MAVSTCRSSKLGPAIWSCDAGHIGIHGGVAVCTVVLTEVQSYSHTVTKTKISRTDIFLPMVLSDSRAPLKVN